MQAEATVSINGAEPVLCGFAIDVEQVDVSTFGHWKPDMAWEYLDPAGHFHAFDHDGELPTLERREQLPERGDVPPDDDYWFSDEVVTYHCLVCGAEVEPRSKYVPTPYRQFAPGRTSYALTMVGPVPAGRFSVVVTVRDQVFFGFAEGPQVPVAGMELTLPCGPMSWRKRSQ